MHLTKLNAKVQRIIRLIPAMTSYYGKDNRLVLKGQGEIILEEF